MKGKTLNLNEFLAEDGGTGGDTTVTVKATSWADEMENEGSGAYDRKYL